MVQLRSYINTLAMLTKQGDIVVETRADEMLFVPSVAGHQPHRHTATDISIGSSANSHLSVLADTAKELPLRSESVDAIIALDVLQYLQTPREFLREVGRILAPVGRTMIPWPSLYHIHEAPCYFFRPTEYGFRVLLRDEMALVAVDPYGGGVGVALDPVLKMLGGLSSAVQRVASGPFALLAHVTRRSGKQRALGRRFPMGYVAIAEKKPHIDAEVSPGATERRHSCLECDGDFGPREATEGSWL